MFYLELRAFVDSENVSSIVRSEIRWSLVKYDLITRRIEQIQKALSDYSTKNVDCTRLESILGIGPHISSAIVSTIGKGQAFNNARDFAVWTGITPIQKASGFKSVMSGITKRGDRYLGKLFVQAARHTAQWAKRNPETKLGQWINQIIHRRGVQKSVVAIAYKLARISWISLNKEEKFKEE